MKLCDKRSICERAIKMTDFPKRLLIALILFSVIGWSIVRSTGVAEGSYSVPFTMDFCKQIDEKSHGLRVPS